MGFGLADILVTPSSWTPPDLFPTQSASQSFLFYQTAENTSSSIAFSESDPNNFLNLSLSTAPIGNGTNVTLVSTLNIPSTASEGTYLMKIKYEASEIPILLTIKKNTTVVESVGKCRLEPFPDSYTIPFVAGSPTLTQQFGRVVSARRGLSM